MDRRLSLSILVILAWHVTSCHALGRTTDQFVDYFPTFDTFTKPHILTRCREEYSNYTDGSLEEPPGRHIYSGALLDCILDQVLTETEKAGMAVTGILFALLPVLLANIGPTVSELSFLAVRRPILAALLAYGSLSPNPASPMSFEDLEELVEKRKKTRDPFAKLRFLKRPNPLVLTIISVGQYVIGIAATANSFFQIWRLTYRGVSIAPIVVYIAGLPEETTLFGWAVLALPVHILGFMAFRLAYLREPASSKGGRFRRMLIHEFTPSLYKTGFDLQPRENLVALQAFFSFAVRLCASLHIIAGSALLGSVYFVFLADSLIVIYSFVASAMATRLVLEFELLGLGRALKEREAESSDGGVGASGPLLVNSSKTENQF
ncbi:unnamed protein product [Clonostachys chloroleuca]|uniref:Uncharacterized protein n=1 Tax=Clonostachys chloroleuca TaxID=1926264 RepID=A0AA35PWW8_9HYPO|nr:unnamed protein product [Clonostachys chloroleuca]